MFSSGMCLFKIFSIDFHGSTGYGQAFTDAINQDWGGKPLEDLQKGLAHALTLDPQIDGSRACDAFGNGRASAYKGTMWLNSANHGRDAVQLLLAGEGAVDREQDLLRRLLKVQDAGAREAVLGVVARRGATELVPALRALQERVTGRDAKARVDQTIAQVQGRATGGTGALSLPTEGGGLAVVPDE